MAAYISGEMAAFRELFQRYTPLLQRAMARDLSNPEEANDLGPADISAFAPKSPGLRAWAQAKAVDFHDRVEPQARVFFGAPSAVMRLHWTRTAAREPSEGPRGQERSDAARETARALAAFYQRRNTVK